MPNEFQLLKASHKFLRGDEPEKDSSASWEDQLARKYYDTLYREFAVCNLKHYKTGNFALRWRTESEVLSGVGETTCGNTRCRLHEAMDSKERLVTLELPFSYVEHGEDKFALVKVVLCERCCKKLMWKRTEEKRAEKGKQKESVEEGHGGSSEAEKSLARVAGEASNTMRRDMRHRGERDPASDDVEHRRPRSSRSLSPRERIDRPHRRRS